MEYNFCAIEKKWQDWWTENGIYKVSNDFSKPKYYVLDMFPYPSGAGLHVGHPLGYIASDIYARYKRLKGFNVLHPMGYDAFGLPAEQYAIEHGIHPAVSTKNNIDNFRSQLDKIGFCFDWSREVNTSNPKYYKWTQWIFLQLFNSYFNRKNNKAESIDSLIEIFKEEGNINHPNPLSHDSRFTSREWISFDEKAQQDILMNYRLAYCGIGEVNWCEALGTVLANDEVVNGVSERGGYAVVKKKLRQWYLRITEYADRLLEGLQTVDFSEAMKEMQSNWIGKSYGAEIDFRLSPHPQPFSSRRREFPNDEKNSGNYFKTADSFYWKVLKEYGRQNRKAPTEAEDILWQRLRNNQLGSKVRRQHAIEGFIVDFAFLNANLVIEIDGDYHSGEEQEKYDEARTEYLKEFGFYILRFNNYEVINDIENIVKKIKVAINNSTDISLLRGEKRLRDEALLTVYTTRPDTIFGVDFMVIAPEHELISFITTKEQQQAVDEYIVYVKSRSDRERQAEKKISGVFTGAYAVNPFNQKQIPIWISEYVLAGYGTGAIMAVPCGDERDFKFAKHFNIPITNIIGKNFNGEEANPTKDAALENSDFLNGTIMRDAISIVNNRLEEMGIGKKKVNYKMRDAAFSRQRYWGEPFPIVWKNGIAYPLDENELPLELPYVESYKPGPEGEGPLANIESWFLLPSPEGEGLGMRRETNTMPGYAGSSWYFLRYMDPHNDQEFCDKKASDYWNQVDVYVGGTEHAVGHLLYSRMWTKALCDLGFISFDEPFKKLLNQGMIQGSSRFVYRLTFATELKEAIFEDVSNWTGKTIFISDNFWKTNNSLNSVDHQSYIKTVVPNKLYPPNGYAFQFSKLHVDVNLVDGVDLNIEAFKKWHNGEYANAEFILEDGSLYTIESSSKYICGVETEKMSKSKFNTVDPSDLVEKFGADTFRMYEMFLGPVEQSKPWDTKGIEGVHRFLKKLWRLFFDDSSLSARRGIGSEAIWNDDKANDTELKVLHKAIKKIEEDTERFSYNTAVSAFMVCVNELTDLKCNKKEVLEPLVIMLSSYAPHIAEDLYHQLNGNSESVLNATYPVFNNQYLIESVKEYPVSINGKLRTTINMSLETGQKEAEEMVLKNEVVQKWLEGKPPKKIIFVKGKMVNLVV